jgi:hypothetical protein
MPDASAAAGLTVAADGLAFLAGEAAIAIGVGAVKGAEPLRRYFGERDAAILVGVDPLEALSDEARHHPAALAASLCPIGTALGTNPAALRTIATLSASDELSAADRAVAIGVEAGEAGFPALTAIFLTARASGTADDLSLCLRDEAVTIGIDASEHVADAGFDLSAGNAGAPLRAAQRLLC